MGQSPQHSNAGADMSPDEALALLQEGNRMHQEGDLEGLLLDRIGPQLTPKRREELLSGQSPLATVLTCADSRVSPEVMFGAGLGTIFVVRNAGNIVSTEALASLEFGCIVLKTPLLVVMGHQGCAAVANTVISVQEAGLARANEVLQLGGSAADMSVGPDTLPKYVHDVVGRITPAAVDAIQGAAKDATTDDVVEDAIIRNADLSLRRILHMSSAISDKLRQQPGKGFKAVTAKYSQTTGGVTFFPQLPELSEFR